MPKTPGIERINQFLISHSCSHEEKKQLFHIHPNAYEINLVKYGNVDFQIGDTRYHMKPGDVSMIRPNVIHGYYTLDDSLYERFPVHIEDTYLLQLSTDRTNLLQCFDSPKPRHLNDQQVTLYEYYVDRSITSLHEKSFGYDIRLQSSLSMLVLLAGTAPPVDDSTPGSSLPKVIQDTLAYVGSNFSDDISLQDIADAMNISSSRLCHTFKDLMGISLWNYVISQRINYAQTLLKSGVSVTDACFECGFRDYAHFIKIFHKLTGTTPGQYQKNQGHLQMFNSAATGAEAAGS